MGQTGAVTGLFVRRFEDRDLAAVYDVCVRTGADGEDARGKYFSDDLLADVFAGPYLHLEPELAFVLDDGRRPVGYVIGTAVTAGFVSAYRERWIPRLSGRYPRPAATPATPDDELLARLYRPERMLWPELSGYPAHLHIDVLPGYQGGGCGRLLIETFFEAVAAAGAPGVHVGVGLANVRAHGFYRRLGFEELSVPDPAPITYYGRMLG